MTIEARLVVYLKGADLTATTAFLTLREKMGYKDTLLGLKRFDEYVFTIESTAPEEKSAALRRLLAGQSTFYNRNKHNYFLLCCWDGGELRDGVTEHELDNQLVSEVARNVGGAGAGDFGSQRGAPRVILKDVSVYRAEVVVEELDPSARGAIARKLGEDLSTDAVAVSVLGTRWALAIRAGSGVEAKRIAEEIAVSTRRDAGLLLNPHYQGFAVSAVGKMELAGGDSGDAKERPGNRR